MTETEFDLPFDDEIYQKHRALVDLGIENLKVWEINGYHESIRWIEAYHKQLSKANKSMEKKINSQSKFK